MKIERVSAACSLQLPGGSAISLQATATNDEGESLAELAIRLVEEVDLDLLPILLNFRRDLDIVMQSEQPVQHG